MEHFGKNVCFDTVIEGKREERPEIQPNGDAVYENGNADGEVGGVASGGVNGV